MARHRLSAAAVLAVALSVSLVAACAGGGNGSRSAVRPGRCGAPGDSTLAVALVGYLTGLRPTPQRFLIAAGTDSTLPEPARLVLQDKGPTYYYPGGEVQQKTVRAKLASVGAFTTLLVVPVGVRLVARDSAVARFRGWYVGGQYDGQAATPRAVYLSCTPRGWTVARAEEEHIT